MDEILKSILQNTVVEKNTIHTHIKHPINGKKLPNRTFYVLLKKYANDFLKSGNEPRMVGLAGLRGTGKTTLMWQIAEYIRNTHKGYCSGHILTAKDAKFFAKFAKNCIIYYLFRHFFFAFFACISLCVLCD